MDVVAFLNARLDEDERAAKDAADEPPTDRKTRYPYPERLATCMHNARHDPARVFREVEAKRRILAAYERAPDWTGGEDVRYLAAVYSDHPDYDPAWKEQP